MVAQDVRRLAWTGLASSLARLSATSLAGSSLIMRMLREGLNIKVNQDAQGNIIGVWIMARAHIGGSSDVSDTATERDEDDPADQGQ